MKLTVTENTYEAIPRGLYIADVESLEDVEGRYGEQIRFNLRIVGREYNDKKLTAWANPILSPKSKLYRWLKQLNFDLSVGAVIDIDALVGKRVLIKVEQIDREDGSSISRVSELMDVGIMQALTQQATQPATDGNGDAVSIDSLRAQLAAAAS
ncbi:MAG: hypothetical protein ACE5HA_09015 [Anaerolineae bacterium]